MEAITAHAGARIAAGRAMIDEPASDLEALVGRARDLREEKARAMEEFQKHVLSHHPSHRGDESEADAASA